MFSKIKDFFSRIWENAVYVVKHPLKSLLHELKGVWNGVLSAGGAVGITVVASGMAAVVTLVGGVMAVLAAVISALEFSTNIFAIITLFAFGFWGWALIAIAFRLMGGGVGSLINLKKVSTVVVDKAVEAGDKIFNQETATNA